MCYYVKMAFIGDTLKHDWRDVLNNFIVTAGGLTIYQYTVAPYFEELGGESPIARTLRAAALCVTLEEARKVLQAGGFNLSVF